MIHPLLWPAIAWAAGIGTAKETGFSAGQALVMAGACLAAGWLLFFLGKAKTSFAFLIAASFFLGAAVLSVREAAYDSKPLHLLNAGGYLDFVGRLYKSPSRGIDSDHYFLRVEELETAEGKDECSGNLRLTMPHSSTFPRSERLLNGDRVRMTARIIAPAEYRNFGPPRLADSLKSRNLHNLAFSKSSLFLQGPRPRQGLSITRAASGLRQSLQDKVEEYFADPKGGGVSQPGALLEALLLGERGRMDDEMTLGFQESGLLHLIAISGAHIGMISVLLLGLFRGLGIAPRPSALLLLGSLVFYSVLVEGTPSVLRATIMAVSLLAGRLLWRESDILNALALSILVLLILNPFSLFDPGFQLTYAATLSIVLFQPRIMKRLPRLPLRIGQMLAMSLAAQAGVMPIIAGSFNRVAAAPLLLNLAAVPLVAAIMAMGYIFFPLAFLSGLLARIMAFALKFSLMLLLGVSRLAEVSALLSFRVANPSGPVVLGYYVFLLALLLPHRFRLQTPALLAGYSLFVALMIFPPLTSPVRGLKLTFLDVGQGDSILIEFPGRAKMLVDAGGSPTDSFDTGERVVSPVLWRKGVTRLAVIAGTHDHPDHIGGLAAVARNFKPAELWQTPCGERGELRRRIFAALPSSTTCRNASRGFSRTIAGVRLDVLHPSTASPLARTELNDRSLVLRLRYGRTSFLLTGDIGFNAEGEIIRSGLPLRCGVLKAGHHGSDSSSGPEFLREACPRIVVITVGPGNAYGFPREETLKRFRAVGSFVYRTDRDGAVEISSDGRSYAVRTARESDRVRIYR